MRRLTQERLDSIWRIVEDLHQTRPTTLHTMDQMSSARCGQVKLALGSCLGEKEMKSTNEMDHTTLGQELMKGRRLRPERWGEHFQDLSGWCQPNKMSNISSSQQSDEQLNTPIVTVQDEFDFGMRSSEGALLSDVDCDLWDTTVHNTQGELWESVNDWLTFSPESTIEDVNNLFVKKELVKSEGDFLLSQSPITCKIKTEKTFTEPLKNVNKIDQQKIFKPYREESENTISPLFCKPIKKEPLFEDLFINDVDSSCTFTPDKLLSPTDIHRDDMVAAEEIVITSEDACVATEEPIAQAVQPHTVPLFTVFVKPEPSMPFKIPEETVKPAVVRPKLKLDIDAALMTTHSETMDTPEVLQPLVDEIGGFSLLSYVCDDETNVLSTITGSCTNQMTCLTIPTQKRYSENVKMPFGKYNTTKTGKRKQQSKTTEENTVQPSSLLVANRPKRKSAENFKLVSKKRRISDDFDELQSLNSTDTSVLSDSDESFISAKTKSNRKKRITKTIVGRKRKISSVDSDIESVGSTSDRYRELRDRNNEASRKSRLNRKSRETEMKAQAQQLEKDNRLLKIKADEMEKLVKKLRENLMNIVLKRS